MPGFVLLVRPRGDGDSSKRIGITVSGKVGGAVVRNRMKRRFRELARKVLPEAGIAGADHILIGRPSGIERDYALLESEFRKALAKLSSKILPGTGRETAREARGGGGPVQGTEATRKDRADPGAPSTGFAGPPPRSGEDQQ